MENGIEQGSVISPTLFNIAIHDIADNTHPDSHHIIFADDVTFFTSDEDPERANLRVQQAAQKVAKWCEKRLSLIHI